METCVALYDWQATQSDQISFQQGNEIQIIQKDGVWWLGQLNGQSGLFPSNYVQITASPAAAVDSVQTQSTPSPSPQPAQQPQPAQSAQPAQSPLSSSLGTALEGAGTAPSNTNASSISNSNSTSSGSLRPPPPRAAPPQRRPQPPSSSPIAILQQPQLGDDGPRGTPPAHPPPMPPPQRTGSETSPSSSPFSSSPTASLSSSPLVRPPMYKSPHERMSVFIPSKTMAPLISPRQPQFQTFKPTSGASPLSGMFAKPAGPEITGVMGKTLFDYTASRPNQVSFVADEWIIISDHTGKWWKSTVISTGQTGLAPSNFIELKPDEPLMQPCAPTEGKIEINRNITFAAGNLVDKPVSTTSDNYEVNYSTYQAMIGNSGKETEEKTENQAPLPQRQQEMALTLLRDSDYPFDSCEGQDHELMTKDGKELLGASLIKIISMLTSKDQKGGTSGVQAFLLTYRSFTEPRTVLHLLQRRFNVPDTYEDTTLEAIKIRVWSFMREWVNDHFYDFKSETDGRLMDLAEAFINEMCRSTLESVQKSGEVLKKIWELKIRGIGATGKISGIEGAPKILQPTGPVDYILDVSPPEMARQLSLLEFEIFEKIEPKECFGLAWSKKDGATRSPNITQFINNFNKIGQYVTVTILKEDSPKKRRKLVEHYLKIAEECFRLNNFNSTMEIISALGSSPISRLKKTWNDKLEQHLHTFASLMERNFSGLRELTLKAPMPVLPYMGTFLKDLTFIDEGNPDRIEGHESLINWGKAVMQAQVIQQIIMRQKKGYVFRPCMSLQSFVKGFNLNISEKDAFDLSLKIEPRESK
eukprot:TRINITY_DN20053_c0_g1_i1.p1 TRINITY_DN20053_c0_g1~~TRINITY_DN20053_c0_g1_i1.p1  ORF type:complete len:813 (-),score=206.78 TRINITY_DN20053_c0_g1_i1:20-2458(-)